MKDALVAQYERSADAFAALAEKTAQTPQVLSVVYPQDDVITLQHHGKPAEPTLEELALRDEFQPFLKDLELGNQAIRFDALKAGPQYIIRNLKREDVGPYIVNYSYLLDLGDAPTHPSCTLTPKFENTYTCAAPLGDGWFLHAVGSHTARRKAWIEYYMPCENEGRKDCIKFEDWTPPKKLDAEPARP